MSLHNRLTLLIMLCITAALGAAAVAAIELNRERAYAFHREKVGLVAEILGNGLRTLMLEGRGREFQKFLETLVAEDIDAIRIFTENGTILNSSVPGEVGRRVPQKFMSVYRAGPGPAVYLDRRNGREVYTQIVLIRNELFCQRCHGSKEAIRGILDVELSGHDTDQRIAAAWRRTLAVALVALVLLLVAVRMVVVRLVKEPLDELLETVRGRPGGQQPLPSPGRGEMAVLKAEAEAMIGELRQYREDLSRCTIDRNLHVERMAGIGELSAAVAHGIKNPLAGISGALQVLAEDFPSDSPRKEIANEVLREIERLDAAVKDLLFFAHPPELNLIPADVNAIIEKVRFSIEPEALRRSVRLTVVCDGRPEVMLDPQQMEKALLNIATHCIQSMERGGELTIGLRSLDPGAEITVTDTAPAYVHGGDIFKPFFSTKHSGTGLGLAISRNIIEGHMGTVTAGSSARGNTFRIVLGNG